MKAAEASQGPLAERGHDLRETPIELIEALCDVERLPRRIWEPACGPGVIVNFLRGQGCTVFASDLVDYGCPDSQSRWDFLMEQKAPQYYRAIVTNPPYKLANEFVAHARRLVPRVYMLLRWNFYEGTRRAGLLESGDLARIWLFANRVPMMHRLDWEGPRIERSRISFAWYIWDQRHEGPTEVRRLRWNEGNHGTDERNAL